MLQGSRRIRDWKRFQHVVRVLIKYEFGYFLNKMGLHKGQTPHSHLHPVIFRKMFEELGGAFLKVGQLLS